MNEPCLECPIYTWDGILASVDQERAIRADERRLIARHWQAVLTDQQQVRLQQAIRRLDPGIARDVGALIHLIQQAMTAINEEHAA